MLEEIDNRVRSRKSFALETTLSGRSYVQKIKEWQELGYQVKLIFLSLPTADLDVLKDGHIVDVTRRQPSV
jgi:predicted ABC-type ATPase